MEGWNTGVVVLLFVGSLKGCSSDPDLFPTSKCSHVICNHDNRNNTCCKTLVSPESEDSSLKTETMMIFFVVVTGALALMIFMMYCSSKMNKKCGHCHRKSQGDGRSRGVSTTSAGVQTTSSDVPPPYIWSTESQIEVTIPRCPSYVKDPPKYNEIEMRQSNENIDHTNTADIVESTYL